MSASAGVGCAARPCFSRAGLRQAAADQLTSPGWSDWKVSAAPTLGLRPLCRRWLIHRLPSGVGLRRAAPIAGVRSATLALTGLLKEARRLTCRSESVSLKERH